MRHHPFHSAEYDICRFVYFGDAVLFYFILLLVYLFWSYAPFDWKFSNFIQNCVLHNSIHAVDGVNVC